MPIRFRCAYCSQLLSIATRKAGTVVRCPTCAGQVIVPGLEDLASVQSSQSLIFERADFPELLTKEDSTGETHSKSGSDAPSGGQTAPPPGSWGTHAEPAYDLEKLRPRPLVVNAKAIGAREGIFLTRRQMLTAGILALVLLLFTFAAGVIAGYFLAGGGNG